jgi:hypothetical protein
MTDKRSIGEYVTFGANDYFYYRGRIVSIDRTRPDMPRCKIAVTHRFAPTYGINNQGFGRYVEYAPRSGLWSQFEFDLYLSEPQPGDLA